MLDGAQILIQGIWISVAESTEEVFELLDKRGKWIILSRVSLDGLQTYAMRVSTDHVGAVS